MQTRCATVNKLLVVKDTKSERERYTEPKNDTTIPEQDRSKTYGATILAKSLCTSVIGESAVIADNKVKIRVYAEITYNNIIDYDQRDESNSIEEIAQLTV